jgi:hypothetical protein
VHAEQLTSRQRNRQHVVLLAAQVTNSIIVHTIPGGNTLPGIFFHYFLLIRQTFYSFYPHVMIKYYAYSVYYEHLARYFTSLVRMHT